MKEQYIAMRNRKVIDLSVLYTFVREQGAKMSFEEFQFAAPFLDFNLIIDHIDRVFELVKLHDKNDNFIKVIE
jgi:hypothetical protein